MFGWRCNLPVGPQNGTQLKREIDWTTLFNNYIIHCFHFTIHFSTQYKTNHQPFTRN